MASKHGLKTAVGIKEKKIEALETKLDQYESVQIKSPEGEALKAGIRVIFSYLVGVGIAYLYSRFPLLGELAPDTKLLVEAIVGLLVFMSDKWKHQFEKNKGNVLKATGIDWLLYTFGGVMSVKKSPVVSLEAKTI